MAEATGDVEKILEQFMIERLLDTVNPELREWLKRTRESRKFICSVSKGSARGRQVCFL